MAKEIRLNAFIGGTPAHLSPGLWALPHNRAPAYTEIDYWTELAQLAERGKFDALFIADGIDVSHSYAGWAEAAVGVGLQHDPLMLIAAMADVTKDLGFAVTASTSHEIPAVLARRLSSLDHLTRGRIGWNIDTGLSAGIAGAVNSDALIAHSDATNEFLSIVYKLWEGSWTDDAVKRDRASGVFADPAQVRRVRHQGARYQVDTIHLTEPSPQRTPLLFQAGDSQREREFAAAHAEAVFLAGPSKAAVAPAVGDIRKRAAHLGRAPGDIVFFALATAVTGRTRAEAKAKLDEYRSCLDPQRALALFSAGTGTDFPRVDIDAPLSHFTRDSTVYTAIEAITCADPHRAWTLRDVIVHNAIGGKGPLLVGTPADIVDELVAWVEETGVDGFNLNSAVTLETYADFVDLVVPEMQRRGVYKTAYASGTLRAKIHGVRRLKPTHPGTKFRNLAEADLAVGDVGGPPPVASRVPSQAG